MYVDSAVYREASPVIRSLKCAQMRKRREHLFSIARKILEYIAATLYTSEN